MRAKEREALGPQTHIINARFATTHPERQEPVDYAEVDALVEKYRALRASEALVLILQDIQRAHRYIPEPAMRLIGERMGLPMVQIYGVASFYQDFSMQPRARYTLNVCEGTSCYIRGADGLRDAIRARLGIDYDGITEDGLFGVARADYCYGCCQLGPVVEVDHVFHPHLTPQAVVALIDRLAAEAAGGPQLVAVAAPESGVGPGSAHAAPEAATALAVEPDEGEQATERLAMHGDRVGEDAAAHETQVPPRHPGAGPPEHRQRE